jgi:hypothetical protein
MMRNFFEKGSLESERVWEMKVKSVWETVYLK